MSFKINKDLSVEEAYWAADGDLIIVMMARSGTVMKRTWTPIMYKGKGRTWVETVNNGKIEPDIVAWLERCYTRLKGAVH